MKSTSKENKIKPFDAQEENGSVKSITISTISLNKPIKDLDVLSDLNKNLLDEEANQSEVDINNNNVETNCAEKNILLFKRSRKGDASEKQLTSRESSPENYEYLVTLRKVSSKKGFNNSQRMSYVKPDALNSTAAEAAVQEPNELNEINLDEEYFNESLIKDVVSQCFDELSKNQTKIPSSHVTFKGKMFIILTNPY